MSVFLSNLDDFITPGQACVNPLVNAKIIASPSSSGARITLQADVSTADLEHVESNQRPNLIGSRAAAVGGGGGESRVASVTLNDCLACSGCVTSAETVLIQLQSFDRLVEKLEEAQMRPEGEEQLLIVVAVSPQSRASIAHKLGLSSQETFLRLAAFFKKLGVAYVLDSSSAGDVSLIEAREEFLHRHRGGGRSSVWAAPPSSSAVSSTKINEYDKADGALLQATAVARETEVGPVGPASRTAQSLPMIISACPGFVCYAEKMQPQCLSYISTAKSAQQILGAVFKRYFSKSAPRNVYMVSVQPCFDKKLEASRLDFYEESRASADVDLVISTSELWALLQKQAQAQGGSADNPVLEMLLSLEPDACGGRDDIEGMFRCFSADGSQLVMASHSEAGSGGYMDYIARHAAAALLGQDLWGRPTLPLPLQVGRNIDIAHVELASAGAGAAVDGGQVDEKSSAVSRLQSTGLSPPPSPSPPLRFAKVYGFRNIQSLMLKMKRGKCEYDLVEVMACPSGCVNGGGQLRSSTNETAAESRERIAAVGDEFHRVQVRSPEDNPLVQFLYSQDRLRCAFSEDAMSLLHTRYHAVPKLEELAPLAAKW